MNRRCAIALAALLSSCGDGAETPPATGFATLPQEPYRTLAEWRETFCANLPRITAQGFDTRFARTWEFYLAYCEAGFAQGSTDVVQFTLRAPSA